MKQRIHITIEEELLDALREIVKQNDTNISQCITDMILSSNEMGRYELRKLLERDGHLCSYCGKQFDLHGDQDDALPYVVKIYTDGDNMFTNKQLICTECRDKRDTEKLNSLKARIRSLREKRRLSEDLKYKKQQMDAEIDDVLDAGIDVELDDFEEEEYNKLTQIDMIWFNGWMQNICREAKRGIVPFSDRKKLLNVHNRPVMYDDKHPIENSYITGATMYPIVMNCLIDELHHDIIDTFSECYGNINECGVEAYVIIDDCEDGPYIYVRFRDSICEYFIYDNGDWCMGD